MECPYCKEEIKEDALKCKHCKSMINSISSNQIPMSKKSKIVALVLALLFGGFGIHKFYLGAWGWGIAYMVLVWTLIPSIVSLVEVMRYFTLSDEEFKEKAATLNGPFAFLW